MIVMPKLFAIILLLLVAWEMGKAARPEIAVMLLVLWQCLRGVFRIIRAALDERRHDTQHAELDEERFMFRREGTSFAVEGQLWNIYSRLEGGERMFWSGRVDWPGGDDWVEIISQKRRSLAEVLPDEWIAFNPRSVSPELIAAFQAAYQQRMASLPPADRKEHVESLESSSWREMLGIAVDSAK